MTPHVVVETIRTALIRRFCFVFCFCICTPSWLWNKAILVQLLLVPGGWGSQIWRYSAHESGTVVSHTHWPPLSCRKYFWYWCMLETGQTPGSAIRGTSHIIRKVLQCETWSLSGGGHRLFKRSTRKKRPVTKYNNYNDNDNNNNNNNIDWVHFRIELMEVLAM
jgi:hypothetical protein